MDLLLGHVQRDSGNAPLHRPGWTSDTRFFLDGPLGMLVRIGSFGCQSACNSVAHIHPESSQRQLAGVALNFRDHDRCRVVLNGHPAPPAVRPPSLRR